MMSGIFDEFNKKRSLVIVPHPDDEIIGAGGLLIKYGKQIDTICISSSGIPSPEGKYSAEERNKMRIAEWKAVMEHVNIHQTFINSTYGTDYPFISKLNKSLPSMLNNIDMSVYDYIFVPGFLENHMEHRWATYKFLPALLKKKHKKELKIVLYEVWALLPRVTDYLDISDVIEEKIDVFQIYVSQLLYIDYDKRVEGLDRYRGLMAHNVKYAEAYDCMSINKYNFLKCIYQNALNISAFIRKHKKTK